MNKTLITWIAIIVLVVLGVIVFKNSGNKQTESTIDVGGQSSAPGVTVENPSTATSTSATPSVTAPQVKTFTVTGKSFSFTPSTITVNKGDTVRINFVNENGMHDWVVDEFNARTKVIQGGQTDSVEFVADKSGSFEYYCSVGTHRQMGMKGTLIVK